MADRRVNIRTHESRSLAELAALHADPVFYGRGVPRGDGRPVLVVPGLFGTDLYLQPLRAWLARIGYRPLRSTLSVNAGCPERLSNQLDAAVAAVLDRRPGPLALIGHSRGGMLCWALAARLQERVSHLALVGSPAPAVVTMMRAQATYAPSSMARRSVAAAGARAVKLLDPDCTVPACGCPYVQDMRRDLSVRTRVVAFYSDRDQVVRPEACRVPGGDNVEVGGTHSGLAHNRRLYPPLARFLAT